MILCSRMEENHENYGALRICAAGRGDIRSANQCALQIARAAILADGKRSWRSTKNGSLRGNLGKSRDAEQRGHKSSRRDEAALESSGNRVSPRPLSCGAGCEFS